jgi:hypothetical protein
MSISVLTSRLQIWMRAARKAPWSNVAARALGKMGIEFDWLNRQELLGLARQTDDTRAMTILSRALGSVDLDAQAFWRACSGRNVVEVGCGRLGGLGPALVSAGVARYTGIDPGVKRAFCESAAVMRDVIAPALKSCAQMLDREALSLAAFTAVGQYESGRMEDANVEDDAVDLFVSISCLEHILDIDAALEKMTRLGTPESLHVHLVNFGNHTDKSAPFSGLYEVPRAEYLARWGHHINGLRLPELVDAFRERGIKVCALVLDRPVQLLPEYMHASWTSAFDYEVLAVRSALVVSEHIAISHET